MVIKVRPLHLLSPHYGFKWAVFVAINFPTEGHCGGFCARDESTVENFSVIQAASP